jgi:hypothetical protein
MFASGAQIAKPMLRPVLVRLQVAHKQPARHPRYLLALQMLSSIRAILKTATYFKAEYFNQDSKLPIIQRCFKA